MTKKRIIIEFFGGPRDGVILDSDSKNDAEGDAAFNFYDDLNGGQIGQQIKALMENDALRILSSESPTTALKKLDDDPRCYTVRDRVESKDLIYVKLCYSAIEKP